MTKLLCSAFVGVCVSLPLAASGASIILVRDNQGGFDDADLITALEGMGHTVSTSVAGYQTLDATKIATLNAADLVIVSRNTNSGAYATNADEINAWNGITAPLMLGSTYLLRTTRWDWVDTTATTDNFTLDVTAPTAAAASHPIYDGLTSSESGFAGNPKYNYASTVDVGGGSDNVLGDGVMIGSRNNEFNQHVIFAEWQAGDAIEGTSTVAGHRMFVALPLDYNSFTDNGKLAFENAVNYMVVPEPGSSVLLGAGVLMLGMRRRR